MKALKGVMASSFHDHEKNIITNKHKIDSNKKDIEANKTAIEDLRKNYIHRKVFEDAVGKFDRIVHRLILVLCGVIALLFITNAAWLYAWEHADFGSHETNITQRGETNSIGG